jgi:hypothetical protein
MALDITPITIIIPTPSHITASGLANFFITLPRALRTFATPFGTSSIDFLSAITIKPLTNVTDTRNRRRRLNNRLTFIIEINSTPQSLTDTNQPDQMLTVEAASIGILE